MFHFTDQALELMERVCLTGGNDLSSLASMDMSEVPPILPTPHSQKRTNRDDDRATESAVLGHVMKVHPVRITIAEVTRELEGENPDFEAKDAIERAAKELSDVGLLHLSQDEFLTPTRAAFRSEELRSR